MNDLNFDTFICVAESGSFNKAAEVLFLTSTAVIKQINLMESELGFQLFERTHRGLRLTSAGASLYKDAKYIANYTREAIHRARTAMLEESRVIRIGTSPMTPAQLLTDLWPKIHEYCADISFQIVPFDNTPENAREILQNLGNSIDVVTGIFDETLLELRKCAGMEISREPICCAVSIYHPLAVKDRLTVEDLYGENLLLIHPGWSRAMDELRRELTERHPQINIEDFDFYDMNIFNRAEQNRDVLAVIRSWDCVHPMMKVLPVDWEHAIPFGLLYPPHPSPTVARFLDAVEKVLAERKS